MTWFKENKFLAGLISITALVGALLIFLGLKSGTSLEAVQGEIAAKQSGLEKMKNLDPYPTIKSAKEKEANLVAVLAEANEARKMLLAFRPETMANVPGKAFSENLTATVSKVKELFPGEDDLPKGFNLGFKAYSSVPPKEGSTGVLTYQLGALEYLFEELHAAGVTNVRNLHRVKLPAENGDDWPDAAGAKRGGGSANRGRGRSNRNSNSRNSRGRGNKPVGEVLPPVAHRLPFELVFKSPEGPARLFLASLANSDKYFFETRFARVTNPSPTPTAGKSASVAKPKSPFGDFVVEGEEPAADAAASSEQILNKVSGGDELVIYLRADLLLFIAEQKFPELK
ncbi:MAG: hypothetical protein ACI8UZ_001627 [Akkermansiaceae bacterium]|jgi:hypothetical protein